MTPKQIIVWLIGLFLTIVFAAWFGEMIGIGSGLMAFANGLFWGCAWGWFGTKLVKEAIQ